jgi:RimJ/RimL family protein N-acetyltransferase
VLHTHWPLFGLVVRTPLVELRPADDDMLGRLATLAADGVHDPDVMPFIVPWTRAEPPQLQRDALRYWWGQRASWQPDDWTLTMAVLVDGEVVGVQDLGARDFAVTRSVSTGSWLGRHHQGRGIGTEMRAAILHLAFAGLGAETAESGAFEDNPASLAVSAKLGYEANGVRIHAREGRPAREVRLALSRARWEDRRRSDIGIDGLDHCLDWFGAPA